MIAKLEKGEAIIPEKQQESLFEILDFEESMMGKYGKLFAAMGNTDLMTPMMQEQIKQDAQQAQSVVTHGGDNYNIDVPVQIYPLQKLTEQEVAKLAKIIGKNTIYNMDKAHHIPGTRTEHFGHWSTFGLNKFNSDL